MMFLGREPPLPIDLLVGRPPDNMEIRFSNYTEYVDKLRCKMQQIHELASQKLLQASNRQKRNYDFRQHRIDYEPGDPVFVRNETRKKGYSPKLQPRWSGSYMVLGQVSDFVYEIQLSPKARHLAVHHDRLKPFHGEFQGWLPKVDTTSEPGSIENARVFRCVSVQTALQANI